MQARATAAVFFSPDRKWDAENIRRIYSKVGGAKHCDVESIFQNLVQFQIIDSLDFLESCQFKEVVCHRGKEV